MDDDVAIVTALNDIAVVAADDVAADDDVAVDAALNDVAVLVVAADV